MLKERERVANPFPSLIPSISSADNHSDCNPAVFFRVQQQQQKKKKDSTKRFFVFCRFTNLQNIFVPHFSWEFHLNFQILMGPEFGPDFVRENLKKKCYFIGSKVKLWCRVRGIWFSTEDTSSDCVCRNKFCTVFAKGKRLTKKPR